MTQPLDPIVPAGSDGAASASTRDTYFEAIGRHEVLDTEAFLASYRQSMNAVAPLESFGLRPRLRHALMMSAFRARKLAARLKGRRGVPFSAHLDALPDRTHLRLTIRDPAPSGTLTDEERTFFSTYGLLPPRRVAGLEGERLDDLHEELLAMTMGSRAGATHMHLVSERVLDLAMEPSILGVVKSLLGDDVAVSNSSGFVKPPRTGVTTQWHSATPKSFAGRYAPEDRYCVNQVTVWIALTDAREDNGCMMMVPRSFIADVFDEFLVALQQIDRGDTFLDIPDEWMSERIRRGRDMKYAVDDKTAMEANAYFETVQQLFKLGFNETCDFFPRLVRANGLTAVKLEADPG
ncbi:MAG: phytanoyl-CoA dioxygenase family protein, partial [Polyangiales bacterium]